MRAHRLALLAFLAAAVVIAGAACRSFHTVDRSPGGRAGPLAELPERSPREAPRVVLVRKADRVLGVYLNGRLAGTYPIALGSQPQGRKQREGDGRTPEGEYYLCTRNPNSSFHLFLGLSYPNAEDAAAGRRAGVITEQQYRAIALAIAARRQPPWDTFLGGEIGLHGNGSSRDWTLGCIALEDEDIEALWEVLKVGDPVVVEP